jgi:hypothetical protein
VRAMLSAILKPLAVIVIGVFVLVYGVRSIGGVEGQAKHLQGGVFVEITCSSSGHATGGPGFLSASADAACSRARDAQRGRAPWWVLGGLAITGFGVIRFRKARAATRGG